VIGARSCATSSAQQVLRYRFCRCIDVLGLTHADFACALLVGASRLP
jgi:hypothetical protein